MASTVRLFVDASYAIAIMALVGIVAGSATAGITSDTERSLQVGLAMFVLTVAAAEAAIGLAILVVYFRNRGSIAVEDLNVMKG
jgi:NADH-quinone oxidoreductase subunit K